MRTSSPKKRLVAGFASLAVAATLGSTLAGGAAHADPKQYTAAVGVGSDTVQDVFNAFAGTTNGAFYSPLSSGAATGGRQLISFDAINPTGGSTCITAKLNGPTFTRPNGSGAGRKALYASSGLSTTGFTGTSATGTCATGVDISGQVDFARSSSVSSSVVGGATVVSYLPFGRDGVSFAYYRKNGAPVTTLSKSDLVSLYTTGSASIGGVRIIPCGLNLSSGTFAFWNQQLGVASTENAATTECNNLLGARAEENDGTALKARGDALAAIAANSGDEVVVAFSAASFIAKSNNVAPGAPPAGVGIGSISNAGGGTGPELGSPVTGTAPSLAPNATFFNDTTFGRFVYTVLPTSVATGPGNAAIKALFVGSTSAVCSAPSTISSFGFLPIGTCGTISTQSGWDTAAS